MFRSILFSAALLLHIPFVHAQQIERKIIIRNNEYHYIVVNPENQMATLFHGSPKQKLNKAAAAQIPIGRAFDEQNIPLAFDILGNTLFGVNWILNSNNSRHEAIKQIDLKPWLRKPHTFLPEEWAQVSFDQPQVGPNIPWQEAMAENNVLSGTCFDLAYSNGLLMAVANGGKLKIWRAGGGSWQPVFETASQVPESFSMFIDKKGNWILVDAAGNLRAADPARSGYLKIVGNIFQLKSTGAAVGAGKTVPFILVIDKDRNKNYALLQSAWEGAQQQSLQSLLNEHGIELPY